MATSSTATATAVGVTGLAAAIATVLAGLAWRRRDQDGATAFAGMMAANAVWLVAVAGELLAGSVDAAVHWRLLKRAALIPVPALWAVFVVAFAGYGEHLTRRTYAALFGPVVAAAAVTLTNPVTGWVWSDPRFVTESGLTLLAFTYGPVYWLTIVPPFAVTGVGFALLAKRLREPSSLYRRQVALVLVAALFPTAATLAFVLRLGPAPHLDLTPFAFVAEGLVVFLAVFRYRLLDLSPVARSRVIEDMADGLVVCDDDGRVVDVNPVGRDLAAVEDPLGERLATAYPALSARLDGDATGNGDEAGFDPIARGERHYEPRVTPLTDPQGAVSGRLVVLRDVTDVVDREETLASLREVSRELMRATTTAEVGQTAVDALGEELGFEFAGAYVEADGTLRPLAVSEGVEAVYDELPTYDAGEGLIGRPFAAGETAVYPDVHEGDAPVRDEWAPIQGAVVVPMGDRGVLSTGSTKPIDADAAVVEFVSILAASTAAALDRAEREQQLREREADLERQNERLEEFASVLTHDLRNPLSVARGSLEVAREERDDEALAHVAESLDRMDELTRDLLTMARHGTTVTETEPVGLADVAHAAWRQVETGDVDLVVEDERAVRADEGRLRQLFENCFRNAVEHGSTSPPSHAPEDAVEHGSTSPDSQARRDAVEHAGPSEVRVGTTADGDGFYVADDGVGIPESERESVFERGYTTGDSTGFGLAIVADVAAAHGWEVTATEGRDGGARFEFTGVESVETVTG